MSTMVVTISLVATIYDGTTLRYALRDYYNQGLYPLLLSLTSPLSFYLDG
ncbi:MAG: hypothetical protein NQ127_00460 [Candidatus Cardinium sp.]|nr:hypothetical protein [Candidatus Cardinium sp.]